MKKFMQNIVFSLVVIYLLFWAGCTTTKETIYLQEIEVSGPINQPPIHLMDNSDYDVTISPKF